LTENPKDTAENEITEMHVRALEKAIIEHPDNWLWSHRRWKHKREQ
jgi:KDO2-lipid IV(A) lauroyltransferase